MVRNEVYPDRMLSDNDKFERIIKTINKRFSTYGYKRIKTSAFEQYDLYSKVKSSINQNEMIKVIDYSGQVLVLRPDVTIPITKELLQNSSELSRELRYFYVQEVFRQAFDKNESIERTQAGIEYFCNSSPEADAEVIALACHLMKDLGFNDIKIELGHAGFFNEIVQNLPLTAQQTDQLRSLIQAKNAVEIGPFLQNLDIDNEVREVIERIPFLYGNPVDVSARTSGIALTEKMQETLDYLMGVFNILKMYGLEQYIVMDLGLINHMGYYSGIIFQGYVEKFGKPVLMGGRYDELGNEFGAELPAIGFACEIESLVKAAGSREVTSRFPIDVKITYADSQLEQAIAIANELRERNYSVLSFSEHKEQIDPRQSIYSIRLEKENNSLLYKDKDTPFSDLKELLELLVGGLN
ncbi:ATP phosphoribosyltransferase regulatory subunit [Sporosarcina sp. ANT_H38]|uniref:ATP phosphoribosyltransferase regulatory subunit n=1 Tax=Sporosarcina sp. ANT_H38 TaxID=2597358 RepID=UPI0011F2F563|nr:ATP phosphoribosyltransferase regulatory subunit [Sporosarcina sp. ANT_H38]KAA0964976.1 ATP phosphoribosyltransferase regulatory subunit [Sporosarcina sp. ANT_H38]